ncbi:MAG TPA: cupin domain-containing protein [Streptosporangiaceae bacterium]|nr:cupin domain-containing protein [Streptosporangiaceae bacterium]
MRRVVTGAAEGGGAGIVFDGEPPTVVEFGQYRTTELWVSGGSPPSPAGGTDPSARPWELGPPPGGSCFRIVRIAPDAQAGAPGEDAEDPGFLAEHTTDTIDYIIVISGEVTLTVGGAEVTLGPGDTVVQQGTPHDWRNRGTEPCVMAGVLISTR